MHQHQPRGLICVVMSTGQINDSLFGGDACNRSGCYRSVSRLTEARRVCSLVQRVPTPFIQYSGRFLRLSHISWPLVLGSCCRGATQERTRSLVVRRDTGVV